MAGRRSVLTGYNPGKFFCEMMGSAARPADHTKAIRARLGKMSLAELRRRAQDSERELYNLGITFTVYSQAQAIDRILPFDVIPRVLSREDWATIEAGVKQRVAALNLFLDDIYHKGRILKDGVVPRELVLGHSAYRREMRDIKLRHGTYVHICGIDVVRDETGTFRVLEDNARTPSGVSYVVENRHLMQRAFPDLMDQVRVRPVSNYGVKLREALGEVAPARIREPGIVLLSPGVYNSAYFEHVFLAREMGVALVEGRDLFVDGDRVYMRTTGGPAPVHVIYRRINDDFLDPEAFNPKSMLGVPGLMRAYARGHVTLANAIGTGVADDKAIYAYMPRIIRYYLGEDQILANVETHICREKEGLRYTLDHLAELVTKPVDEAGGYGVVIGPHATREELFALAVAVRRKPERYISQPVVKLSVCPTLTEDGVEPRHVDLRPFAVTGRETWVLPGGLTRVALRRNSLIVNSSQGGGTKDTWALG